MLSASCSVVFAPMMMLVTTGLASSQASPTRATEIQSTRRVDCRRSMGVKRNINRHRQITSLLPAGIPLRSHRIEIIVGGLAGIVEPKLPGVNFADR